MSNFFLNQLHHITPWPAVYEGSNIFTSLSSFVIDCLFFIFTIPVSVKCYFIVVLICISLMANVEYVYFFIGHFYVFFGELSTQSFCSSFNWVICLFIIEFQPFFIYYECKSLIRHMVCKYFCHFMSCIFIFLMVSFVAIIFFV